MGWGGKEVVSTKTIILRIVSPCVTDPQKRCHILFTHAFTHCGVIIRIIDFGNRCTLGNRYNQTDSRYKVCTETPSSLYRDLKFPNQAISLSR
jgi:hypothetical protein